jgi:gliding motility-associated-like protein
MKRVIYFLLLLMMSHHALAQNIKIIASGGLNQMDLNWNTVAASMGYTSSVVPQTTLNNNTFVATTQVLVVSCGTNALTGAQVANIQAFLQAGKGVYLQSEYLSAYPGNIAFSQIVNNLGGNFTWGPTQNDSLAPSITGSLSTLTNAVNMLPYFWYGCTGSSNTCRVIPFVFNGNIPMGWMYDPANTSYGRLITTTDQDWCGGGFMYAQSPLLMKNILYHLVNQNLGDTTKHIQVTKTVTICSGQLPYVWNGISVPAAGNAVATFNTASVGGCDSTTTLNLIVGTSTTVTKTITICSGQLPYHWNGITVNAGGNNVATFTTTTASGCDSTTNLNLIVGATINAIQNQTICANQLPYVWHGQNITAGGNAVATFTTTNAVGCDSITTLNLTVNPIKTATKNVTICSGQLPYTWNGINVTAGGNAAATYTTASLMTGCDSVTTLNLTVTPAITTAKNITICQSQLPYHWNGITVATGGNAVATYATTSLVTNCDSTTTLNLTVTPAITATKNITICQSQLPYHWNGITIAAGGNAVAVYTTTSLVTNCDSATTLNLTVTPPITATKSITICQSQLPYHWNGITVAAGGNAVATYTTTSSVTNCDSTTTLNLTVNPVITTAKNVTICQNQLPYSWNGIAVATGGNAAAVYTTTSLVTGCDSTTTLNLTVKPIITALKNVSICNNQLPYSWNGITVTAAGNAVASYTTTSFVTGCDSTTTLNLTASAVISVTKSKTICTGQLPYVWNGQSIVAGGNAVATFTTLSAAGCDSTTTLNLIVTPVISATKNITICQNQLPYTWNGINVPAGGNAVAVYTTTSPVSGCDSTTTLNLTVHPVITAIKTITICNSQLPYHWNGITITAGGNAVAAYTTTSLVTNCDSTTTLNLIVNPLITALKNITICNSQLPYHWNGITITAGGNAVAAYTTTSLITGCDSVTTLNLTVNPVITATKIITICNSQLPYHWNGITVTTGGNAAAVYTTTSLVSACDSTTTLNLIVTPVLTAIQNVTICANQLPYVWHGNTITAGGNAVATYTSTSSTTGCDSVVTLNLTVNPLKFATQTVTICAGQLPYSWNGISVNAGGATAAVYHSPSSTTGCDSTTTLNLIVNPFKFATQNIAICTNQLPYSWNGINVVAGGNAVAVYHSPSLMTGCDSTTTLNLTVSSVFNNTVNTYICYNQTPYLFGGQSLTQSGSYAHTYISTHGCDSIIHLNLTVSPAPSNLLPVTVSHCNTVQFEGNTYTQSQILNDTFYNTRGCDSAYRTVNIVVLKPSNTVIEANICIGEDYNFDGLIYKTSGSYTNTYTGAGGCDSIRTLDLTVHALPVVSVSVSDYPRVCIGDALLYTASGAARYEWILNNRIVSSENPASLYLPTSINVFTLKGYTEFNCADTTDFIVKAENCCGISIPNAFSPNGDGLNDKFGAITAGHPASYKLIIFDRWGKKIFTSFNVNDQWDGTINGKKADLDVYYFLLESECVDGSVYTKKGDVTLLH